MKLSTLVKTAGALTVVVGLSACQNMTPYERNMAQDAAGSAAGAAVGAEVFGGTGGAAAGAAIGSVLTNEAQRR